MLEMNNNFYRYIPALSILLAVMVSLATNIISFAYIGIIYWTIFRSDFVPISLVFIVGILYDILSGGVVGHQAFIFLTLMGITYLDRGMLLHQDFKYIWLNVSILLLLSFLGNMMITFSINERFIMLEQAYGFGLGIVAFPVFVRLMFPAYEKLNRL